MTEEKTAFFAGVLGELMRSRGLGTDEAAMRELAEKTGLDPAAILARARGEEDVDHPGHFDGLAEELALSEFEKGLIATAFVFQRGSAGDVRARLFDRIREHLEERADQVNDEGESRFIRRALIPFLEHQADLARHT